MMPLLILLMRADPMSVIYAYRRHLFSSFHYDTTSFITLLFAFITSLPFRLMPLRLLFAFAHMPRY